MIQGSFTSGTFGDGSVGVGHAKMSLIFFFWLGFISHLDFFFFNLI